MAFSIVDTITSMFGGEKKASSFENASWGDVGTYALDTLKNYKPSRSEMSQMPASNAANMSFENGMKAGLVQGADLAQLGIAVNPQTGAFVAQPGSLADSIKGATNFVSKVEETYSTLQDLVQGTQDRAAGERAKSTELAAKITKETDKNTSKTTGHDTASKLLDVTASLLKSSKGEK